MEGILLIDKPKGLSSNRAVQKIKRTFKLNKAGHTGTLDPLATGLLPIALGEATKAIPFLNESLKIYEVEGRLGIVTDTFDLDGEVMEEKDPGAIGEKDILALLPQFTGKIFQRPPVFSAVKVRGRPLYRYARRGQAVVPPLRPIQIDGLDLLGFRSPFFRLRVECSRGTYVRSLIHEIGGKLGCGATVTVLRRLRSGPFRLASAVPLKTVLENGEVGPENLWSLTRCLTHLPQLPLESAEEAQRIQQGVPLFALRERLGAGSWAEGQVLLTFRGRARAVLKVEKSGDFRFLRVFS